MGLFRDPRVKNVSEGDQDLQPLTNEGFPPPKDSFNLAYLSYFTLGAGFLLPWNAYITAIDYFSYIYPGKQVDRVFSVGYMVTCLLFLLILITWAQKSSARFRINLGLSLFLLCLLVVPVMDAAYIKGRRGLDVGYYITVTAVVGCGIADAFVQGSLIGSAGELPEEFMQAVVAGTAASGVLVSALRILTKGALPQDVEGLRISAILYFIVSSVLMGVCLVCYNMANRLPVIRYYNDLKERAMESKFLLGDTIVNNSADTEDMSFPVTSKNLFGAPKEGGGPKFWHVLRQTKWLGIGILLIYAVTLSIFPGYITEDVHSHLLKDWYPILLITCYNIFDLVGKSLTAYFMLESATIAIGGSVARLLFYPLFYGCLHGPHFFRTEIPVVLLTCLLGLTNGYFTSVIMIVAPKTVPLQEAETAGIIIVLFLVIGLAIGSIVAWFWVI
ncbi:equilibrative nucleotide transporter 1 [Cryptomeria japonica]|uniref:equilibrative nucleotide transporter 1 n=1 Tax=Cryptomeria japonica TaxID=3369 RepID=UPI0025AB7B51|nr:equilibrative nucleotide transporter 1 [Cryptomeria japonica]